MRASQPCPSGRFIDAEDYRDHLPCAGCEAGGKRLALPTLSLNGSSPRRLAEGYEVAIIALGKALECHQDNVPNARNYATADEYVEARREHEAEVTALREMIERKRVLARHCRKADGQ